MTAAVVVVDACPACDANATSQRETYAFSRSRLCPAHVEMWDRADDHAHVVGCPFRPDPCPRKHCEVRRG